MFLKALILSTHLVLQYENAIETAGLKIGKILMMVRSGNFPSSSW